MDKLEIFTGRKVLLCNHIEEVFPNELGGNWFDDKAVRKDSDCYQYSWLFLHFVDVGWMPC